MRWEGKAWKSTKNWKSESPAEYAMWSLFQEGLGHSTWSVLAQRPHSVLCRKPQFPLTVSGGVRRCGSRSVMASVRFRRSEGKVPNGYVSASCFQILDSAQSHPRSTGRKSPVCAGCRSNSTVPTPNLGMGEVHPRPHSSVPELNTKIRHHFQKA